MKKDLEPMVYAGTGNTNITYSKPVYFPINAILAETLKKDDEVKVIALRSINDIEDAGSPDRNRGAFMYELITINEEIGAKLTFKTLETEFKETKENYETRLKAMLDEIDEGSSIYADITFGPKPLPMILMCVLSFAEKFLNCDVKSVVYGKVSFDENNKAGSPELYDVTSLYYLNNLTNSMVASDAKFR